MLRSETNPHGVDCSHHNGVINWAAVAGSGASFAFLKATQGTSFTDPAFATNRTGARNAGIRTGAYHFLSPLLDGGEQGEFFASIVGSLEDTDLMPVVDIEAWSGLDGKDTWLKLDVDTRVEKIGHCLQAIESKLGMRPMIYTSPGWWDSVIGADFSGHPLWVAHYHVPQPRLPKFWKTWMCWQYDDRGEVPGVGPGVDLDRWNGDVS